MKLNELHEAQYAQALEAEIVLYTLWKALDEKQPTNLRVKKIKNVKLSKKRAAAVARYVVRVIASERLDAAGFHDEAQELRDLPPDVDLKKAAVVAWNTSWNTSYANHDDYAADAAVYYAAETADAAADGDYAATADAAYYATAVTNTNNPQLQTYHLKQMIELSSNIN